MRSLESSTFFFSKFKNKKKVVVGLDYSLHHDDGKERLITAELNRASLATVPLLNTHSYIQYRIDINIKITHAMSVSASNNSSNDRSQYRRLLRHMLMDGEGQHSTGRRGGSMTSKSDCILERLVANSPDFQELQLSSTHAAVLDCGSLVQALQQNQTVRTVRIDGFFVDQLLPPSLNDRISTTRQNEQQKKCLWQALGSLPKLQEMHVNYFVESAVTVEALSLVLSRAFGLTRLFLHDCKLFLNNMAISSGLLSLTQHAALQEVHITQLTLSNDASTAGTTTDSLDPLVPMLMSAPNLRKVILCMSQPQNHILSDDSLSMIAANNNSSLKTLDLRNIVLDNSSIVHLMRQLLATMETTDNRKRNGLRGLVLTTSQDGLNLEACLSIGSVLQHQDNKLELLDLRGSWIEEDGLLAMASLLKKNQTLGELNLRYDNITSRGCDALIDMLRHNVYLETMIFRGSVQDAAFLRMVDFYLLMNTARIRRLLLNVNVDRGQIFDKLVFHVENVDYLFHLLRGNPSFLLVPS